MEYKKIFKEIAKFTHPDKLRGKPKFEREAKLKLFEKAKTALEEDDFYTLREVATSFDVDFGAPSRKHIENLKKKISSIENRLHQLRSSFAWVWYTEEDPRKKQDILNTFLQRVYIMRNQPG